MRARRILRLVAIVLFWIVFAMAWVVLDSRSPNANRLVTWGLVAILTFISVVVHELGHAWAAHSIGGRIDWTSGAPIVIEAMPQGAAEAGWPSVALPSDEDLARSFAEVSRRQMAETAGLLATALAVLSAGGGLVNLIPFDGSDGEGISEALFPSWRA